MDKSMKGLLAIAAAVALTVGGTGSLAYWQASQSVAAAEFTLGTLELASLGDGGWTKGGSVLDPATAVLIPGDYVTYTESFEATVTGDGIVVTADATVGALTTSEPVANGPSMSSIILSGSNLNRLDSTTWEVESSGTISVSFTLIVPNGMTEGQGLDLDLAATTIALTQVSVLPEDTIPCAC